MKHIFETNGKSYTWKDIKRASPKIVYWIIFPQGIRIIHDTSSSYSSVMTARNFKQALKKLDTYNGAYIEKVVKCKLGRWVIQKIFRSPLSEIELWDLHQTYTEIVFDRRKLVLDKTK